MKKIIATIIISLALLVTSITSFWLMIDTNLQLSDVRDRLEHVKLLINDEPENLKNKEAELANKSKKYFGFFDCFGTLSLSWCNDSTFISRKFWIE